MENTETSEVLEQLGLSHEQSLVYLALLEHGYLKAGSIPRYTNLKRGLIYKILEQLIELGLVEKHGSDSEVARFAPLSPEGLRVFVENEFSRAREREEMLDSVFGNLKSQFNLLSGKPSVMYYEGINGLKKLYADINYTGDNILLIRSHFDNSYPEIGEVVVQQIKEQVANNIHTRALTPFVKETKNSVLMNDKNNLVERRILEKDELKVPSQIIIYGKKVSFTSFEKEIATSIIEDESVSTTMRVIFEHLWNKNEHIHEKFMKHILDNKTTL